MTKTILKSTPHRIRVWQQDNNLSDQDVATKFGVHKRTVDRWCHGKNLPTIEQAQMVAEATNGFVGLFDWQTPFTDKRRNEARKSLRAKASKAPAVTSRRDQKPDPKKLLRSARVGKITQGK